MRRIEEILGQPMQSPEIPELPVWATQDELLRRVKLCVDIDHEKPEGQQTLKDGVNIQAMWTYIKVDEIHGVKNVEDYRGQLRCEVIVIHDTSAYVVLEDGTLVLATPTRLH